MVASAIETIGIPTVLVMMFKEVAEAMRPPRVAPVRFPFGRPLGEPGNVAQQRVIIEDGLNILAENRAPGAIVDLPYRWKREDYKAILAQREKMAVKA